MPALSIEDSLPSSQRGVRGRRKFEGGGPAGVALCMHEVLNVDFGIVAENLAGERTARREVRGEVADRGRASVVRDRFEAIAAGRQNCGELQGYGKEMGI